TAFLFVLAALGLVRDGGVVALIQPQSIAAARDAAGIRAEVQRRAAIGGLWTCDEPLFEAAVRVCAPVLTKGARARRPVRRWRGRDFTEARPVRVGTTWGAALASDSVPVVALDSSRRLGD